MLRQQGTSKRRSEVGQVGEEFAARLLEEKGLLVVERDWRCRVGQIDIVARDGDTVVLVEVKTRRSSRFGVPQEAVDARKQHKLRLLLDCYLATTGNRGVDCRIDVVAVALDHGLKVTSAEHIVGAVEG